MKTTLTLLGLCAWFFAKAQMLPTIVTDTIPSQDSLIPDSKEDREDILPVITIAGDTEDGEGPGVSSILSSGRDPFLSAAAFNFSPMRFRLRGYNNGDALYLNGLDLTGLANGFIPFSLWSGLTNMMHARQDGYGLSPTEFALGSTGLNTNIDLRAGGQRAQTQVGYALSNRNYRHRFLLTHGSGFNRKGWAYSFMLSTRYAGEGYVPGTYYRGLSYYAAADKKLDLKNTLSLIALGAPTENGRQAASVQEAMDLAGTNFYNPSWGYQNGKKRNSNVAAAFQPAFMGVYEYKPNNQTNWTTTVGAVLGKKKNSSFDWYNAPDPRPDYYRYLPGYYAAEQPAMAATLSQLLSDNPDRLQVNWPQLYEVNRGNRVTVHNVDGVTGNDISGARSLYILSNRVNELHRIMASSVYTTKINKRIAFTAGADYQHQSNHYYQEVNDLLGGAFWLNVNQFAERDFPNDPRAQQYDLAHPNQLKKKGDAYGYSYKMIVDRLGVWAQTLITLNHFDLFVAGRLSHTKFHRVGLNRNGLFPDNSSGASKKVTFLNPEAKAGVVYKLNGRNYFFVNGGYFSRAPFFDNVFIAPRTRNTLQSDTLKSETTQSFEGGYKLNSPRVQLSITGYYTTIKNTYDVLTFYHDQYQNFVNYALSGMNTLYFGGELGAAIKLTPSLSFNGAAAVGRYYYNSRPNAVVTIDNSAAALASQTVYLKNFRVPSTPQTAFSAGLYYRSPRYWFISITGNYFDNSWLSVNPIRRTAAAIGADDPTASEIQQAISSMIAQEKLPAQFTLDFFGGWSKRLSRKWFVHHKPVYLVFNLGVNNLLNNKSMRSGGFEQLRFDMESKDINKFPPKYYYAIGLNYYASVLLRFN
ncbi:MAG: TonB-dependent receptor [Niabella sp.]|nr:TonB-dependent receptor [Niabella sp.]